MKVYIARMLFDGSPEDETNLKQHIKKVYSEQTAKVFIRRLRNAYAATHLGIVLHPGFPGKWETLTGDRQGEISARLDGGRRLICIPYEGDLAAFTDKDGNFCPQLITEILITEITNYH